MSIRLKLTLIFLALVFIPLFFVSAVTFHHYQHSLEEARLSQFQNLVAYRVESIEMYFSGLRNEMEMAQSFYNIRKHFPVLMRSRNAGEKAAAKKALDGQLRRMQAVMGLSDIMLTDGGGRIIYVSNPGHGEKDMARTLLSEGWNAFLEGGSGVRFSDVILETAHGNRHEIQVAAPAFDLDDVPLGSIIFEVDVAPIYRVIRDTTGLGKSGEVLLGKKVGSEILYLNPLRHDTLAALARHVHAGQGLGIPVQNAVRGETGAAPSVDYRGVKVIAAWKPIADLGWGLVAKMDADEAFEDVTNLKRLVMLILAVVLVVASVIIFAVSQSISQPIKMLTKGVEIIGSGNLDYRVGTNLKDEIGRLSRSFDRMTRDLKAVTASRDELDREIEERKRTEEDLRRSNENLEQFAYVASHDLQEPLRTMASFSQLLEERYKSGLDNDAKDFIGFIVDAANRMQTLITDLLAYSRIGRAGSPMGRIDGNAALAAVAAGLSRQIKESGAVITRDDLPVFRYNEREFVQLLQNLVANAVKFRGAEPPRIHVGAERKDSAWEIYVRDNGIGIDNRFKDRIFQIFRRLHGREKYPGTGIGLSICKKIAEARGGRIWVESAPGEGSTFHFTIPDSITEEAS